MAAITSRTNPPRQQPEKSGGPKLTPLNLLLVLVVFTLLTNLTSLIVSVLMALLLGTILEGPVARLQKRGFPRAAAIAVCYAAIIGIVVAMVLVILPVVQSQADDFRETFPEQMRELRADWLESSNSLLNSTGADLLERGIDFLEGNGETAPNVTGEAAAAAIPIVGSLIGAIASIITTLVVTFYYLLEKTLVRRVVVEQVSPNLRERVDALWSDVERKVGGWLRGQLLLCAIIGTIATVSYGLIGLNFWPLLGLWAGITEILPIVGPWIGGVPAVVVALTMGFDKAILVALVILLMQTLENWFLVPRVMRGAVGLTPLTVFVAILAGTELMGFVGAVLAIPVAAGLQVIITDIINRRRIDSIDERGSVRSWRWMLNRAREGSLFEGEQDYGTQIESDVSYAVDQMDAAVDANENTADDEEEPIVFEEAPRILTEDDLAGDNPVRAAEATWPSNPWKASGPVSRESTPWKAAWKPETPENE